MTTEENNLYIFLFNGRLRFEGDGSSYSEFTYRIEPDDGYVSFPLLTPNSPKYCEYPLVFLVLFTR